MTARRIFLRTLLLLFILCFWFGLWVWWELDHTGHGYRPLEPGLLQWWHDLQHQPEFELIMAQLAYPLFWWATRRQHWPGAWGWLRNAHLMAVALLILLVLIAFLVTPDLGGHWG